MFFRLQSCEPDILESAMVPSFKTTPKNSSTLHATSTIPYRMRKSADRPPGTGCNDGQIVVEDFEYRRSSRCCLSFHSIIRPAAFGRNEPFQNFPRPLNTDSAVPFS